MMPFSQGRLCQGRPLIPSRETTFIRASNCTINKVFPPPQWFGTRCQPEQSKAKQSRAKNILGIYFMCPYFLEGFPPFTKIVPQMGIHYTHGHRRLARGPCPIRQCFHCQGGQRPLSQIKQWR